MEPVAERKRIKYLDALRGMTITILVMVHVSGFCLNVEADTPSFIQYFNEFMLPMFFFISGFLCYRIGAHYDLHHIIVFLCKKFQILIIPTATFFLVSVFVYHLNLIEEVFSDTKSGYWFTFVLFEFFCFYAMIRWLTLYLSINSLWEDFFLIVCGIVLFVITIPSVYNHMVIESSILSLFCCRYWGYFLYFIVGILIKKHFVVFQLMLDKKIIVSCSLVIFFGLNITRDLVMSLHFNFFRLSTALSAIIVLFAFFRTNESLFINERNWSKYLCFVGRRTLDIYFIHYFLLPRNLSLLLDVFYEQPVPIIELAVCLLLSIAIISVCLLIGIVLRQSPFLALCLFGSK